MINQKCSICKDYKGEKINTAIYKEHIHFEKLCIGCFVWAKKILNPFWLNK